MESLFRFLTPRDSCSYLPEQQSQLEYEIVRAVSSEEYFERMHQGWRRFGHALFHPKCEHCQACRSLRVIVDQFRPDRSQRRAEKANRDVIVKVGTPKVTTAKLDLYDRYHAFQAHQIGWAEHPPKQREDYIESFVANPFPTEEWCYYIRDRLIGVGYVDVMAKGLSAIYFYYEPEERDRSLGTFNVLNVIGSAAERGIPHVYLGYFVEGCRSLEYKARFVPNETLDGAGRWRAFRG